MGNTLSDLYTKLDPAFDYIAADAELLTGGNIILIQDPDGIWQPFVITNSDTTMGSAMVKTVQADHLYYELGDGQPIERGRFPLHLSMTNTFARQR